MFEELNQHRTAVAEQIQKATEIGFTGGELEKAHKVGDIHPNGKWVWTQLPSGRFDWRVIKKTGAGAGGAAPATAQEKKISVSANHPALGAVKGVNNVKEYLTTFNSKYTDLSKVTLSKTPKGNWDVRYDGHRLGILNGDQVPEETVKKMGWTEKEEEEDFETFAERFEREYRKTHRNSLMKNSEIRQEAIKAWDKAHPKEDKGSDKKEESKRSSTNPFDAYEDKAKKPDVKYGEMKRAAADKALVGKKITVDGKEGKIHDVGEWKGSGKVFAKVVFDDDFVNKEIYVNLSDIDEGKTKLTGSKNYIGPAGKEVAVELSSDAPERETVTKESLKEFLDYCLKNINKKHSDDFINAVRKFLSTVPRKYRSSNANVFNQASVVARKLMNEFGM